ncbi:MAG: hypothetical protein U5L45_15950 [Saprospiraceae bacterium]|nr:hypothetical protein [Saprospiraceae bacterium]
MITQFIGNQLIVKNYANDSIAKNCLLKIGDVILKVDSSTIEQLIDQLTPLTSGSNLPTVRRNMSYQILRGDKEAVILTILRDGKPQQVEIKRIKPYLFVTRSYVDSVIVQNHKIADDIAYINIEKSGKERYRGCFQTCRRDTRVSN